MKDRSANGTSASEGRAGRITRSYRRSQGRPDILLATTIIESGLDIPRATAAGQVDDLAAELADRFDPPPDEAPRLLDFARLKVAALAIGIDSITRHPGMIMIGHHDRAAMERLRQAAAQKSRVARVVDQKTAVLPLHADTLADPDKLLASLRSLLALAPAPAGRGSG